MQDALAGQATGDIQSVQGMAKPHQVRLALKVIDKLEERHG